MTHTIKLLGALTLCAVSTTAVAQQPQEPPPAWKRQFDDVEVKQIDADELPDPEESVMPSALASKSALPRAVSLETLRSSSERISPFVVSVVVVSGADSSLRQSTVVVQGEAVWISGKDGGAAPILVTNAHYLENAEAIFVRPAPVRESGALPTAARRTVREMQLGADVKKLLADKSLVPATVRFADKHRNLAVLAPAADKLPTPASGLGFFPIEEQTMAAAYGFSHQMGSTLVITRFLTPKKKDHLQYYLHSTFPVILGAPIVAADGRVIAVTSMRHPADQDRTLVIPPRALRKYVEKVQAEIDAQSEENDE